jgi:hypothetical protein
MARAINLDDKASFEAHKIKDVVALRNLPAKLRSVAAPVANRAPNQGLGLNGLRALFARESAKYGPGDFFCHGISYAAFLACLHSHRASRDPPHPTARSARPPSPLEGRRGNEIGTSGHHNY